MVRQPLGNRVQIYTWKDFNDKTTSSSLPCVGELRKPIRNYHQQETITTPEPKGARGKEYFPDAMKADIQWCLLPKKRCSHRQRQPLKKSGISRNREKIGCPFSPLVSAICYTQSVSKRAMWYGIENHCPEYMTRTGACRCLVPEMSKRKHSQDTLFLSCTALPFEIAEI